MYDILFTPKNNIFLIVTKHNNTLSFLIVPFSSELIPLFFLEWTPLFAIHSYLIEKLKIQNVYILLAYVFIC